MGAQQLHQDHQTPQDLDLFHERLDNFLGHKFKIVTLNYFPFIAYEMGEDEDPTSPVTLRDSLDTRILRTLATHLNFTYEVREPKDGKWGVPMADGNWTGIVGTLQHQEADFSLDLTLTEARVKVISHSRIYTHDPLVIVSPKPKPLPRHLALMRPFTGKLWIMIFVSSLTFCIVLWAFQRAWSCVSGGRGLEFSSTLFYSWGVLLEDPPTPTPLNITGQVLVGWWLVFSLVMTSAYRSSLIAHLTVQGKHLPINTFQDLLHQDDWTWGGRELRGTTFLYFNQSNDPVVLHIYRNMKGYELEEALDRVLGGRFSYITYRTQVKVNIPALYTDTFGNTPLHISTTEYPIFGGNSWGFRQGAPFIDPIRRLKQRLIETGFIGHWMKDVMKVEAKIIRAERGEADEVVYVEAEERQVVLQLDHLQGAFYLLALGYTLALLTLLGEKLAHLST